MGAELEALGARRRLPRSPRLSETWRYFLLVSCGCMSAPSVYSLEPLLAPLARNLSIRATTPRVQQSPRSRLSTERAAYTLNRLNLSLHPIHRFASAQKQNASATREAAEPRVGACEPRFYPSGLLRRSRGPAKGNHKTQKPLISWKERSQFRRFFDGLVVATEAMVVAVVVDAAAAAVISKIWLRNGAAGVTGTGGAATDEMVRPLYYILIIALIVALLNRNPILITKAPFLSAAAMSRVSTPRLGAC